MTAYMPGDEPEDPGGLPSRMTFEELRFVLTQVYGMTDRQVVALTKSERATKLIQFRKADRQKNRKIGKRIDGTAPLGYEQCKAMVPVKNSIGQTSLKQCPNMQALGRKWCYEHIEKMAMDVLGKKEPKKRKKVPKVKTRAKSAGALR